MLAVLTCVGHVYPKYRAQRVISRLPSLIQSDHEQQRREVVKHPQASHYYAVAQGRRMRRRLGCHHNHCRQ